MEDYPIINCHVHTFTHENVPDDFLPLKLTKVFRRKRIRRLASFLVRRAMRLIGRGKRDLVERYVRFIEVTYKKKQEDIFKEVWSQYPKTARFIVLPMDMEHMGAGRVREPLEKQHAELIKLTKNPIYKNQIIPFCAVDPRRDGILDHVKRWIEEQGFKGIKLYPSLGFMPTNEHLMRVFEWAEENDIPVLTHCSTSGVRKHKITKEQAAEFSHPRNYEDVLEAFPNLRICLAHFGGFDEWKNYLSGIREDPNGNENWTRSIYKMITSGDYPNLYTDISYTMWAGDESQTIQPLKVLLNHDAIRTHVLFGSDYYMVEREERTERQVSITMRGLLGEEMYKQIAYTNPKVYLGSGADIP